MASIRQNQVAELIRRHFSILLQDQGRYIYEDALVTVTNVKMSPDLTLAKIYLSVYNTENKQAVLLELAEHQNALRQGLAQRIRQHIRRAPDIDLYLDETLDEMEKVNSLFHRLHNEGQMGHEEE